MSERDYGNDLSNRGLLSRASIEETESPQEREYLELYKKLLEMMHDPKLLKSLEKKMQELDAREIAQWEAQSHPDESQRMPPHIFKMLNEKLLREKEEVKEAMCNARKSMPDPVDYGEKVVRFRKALDALNNPDMDAGAKNRLLKDCIERITYSRERPTRTRRALGEAKGTTIKTAGGHWDAHPINIDVKLKV